MTFVEYDPGEDSAFAGVCENDGWTHDLFASLSPNIAEQRIITDRDLQLKGVDRQVILKNGKAINVECKYDRNLPMNFALEYRVRHEPGVFEKPNQLTDLFAYFFWHEEWRLRAYYVFHWPLLKRWWDGKRDELMEIGDRDYRNDGAPFRCYYIKITKLVEAVPPIVASGGQHLFERQMYARQKFAQRLKDKRPSASE